VFLLVYLVFVLLIGLPLDRLRSSDSVGAGKGDAVAAFEIDAARAVPGVSQGGSAVVGAALILSYYSPSSRAGRSSTLLGAATGGLWQIRRAGGFGGYFERFISGIRRAGACGKAIMLASAAAIVVAGGVNRRVSSASTSG
jgi:SNF family Na+-dependent transporter